MKPTLLVMAAGMGSRYGGVKQIDAVGMHGETLLDFGIYDAKNAGFGKVVFIIRKDIEKDFRERLFDRVARNMDAEYVFQSRDSLLTEEEALISKDRTKPWGTIHAVLCAKDVVKTPFAVINSDDYYGRSAYVTMSKYLSNLKNEDTTHAMVGFVLENTMSPSGSVTRAICNRKDGKLTDLVETFKIFWRDGKVISAFDDHEEILTGKELVSMNFFGFTPKAFDSFQSYWDEFKKNHIAEPKTECLLPSGVAEMIEKGEGSVEVLSSDDKWFGMTYPEDKPMVMASLRSKIESGYYPDNIWEN